MGLYVAARYPRGLELISTLFWAVSIIVALFVCCFLAWKVIEWVHDRRSIDAEAEDGRPEGLEDPWEQAISRPPADYYSADYCGGDMGGFGYMNQREQEERFSIYAPRKVRKAMKARRRARQRTQQKLDT